MSCLDGPIGQAAIRVTRAVGVDNALPPLRGLARGKDGEIGPHPSLAENALGLDVTDAPGALEPVGAIARRATAEAMEPLFTVPMFDLE